MGRYVGCGCGDCGTWLVASDVRGWRVVRLVGLPGVDMSVCPWLVRGWSVVGTCFVTRLVRGWSCEARGGGRGGGEDLAWSRYHGRRIERKKKWENRKVNKNRTTKKKEEKRRKL